MATIKLSDGKVVLKDGKASCTCCPEPDCCMYSATTLAAGDLVAADLPDAITLLGVGSLSRSGTGYGDTTDGVIFETDTWAKYVGSVRSTFDCLIRGDGKFNAGDDAVEDQFAATYTLESFDPGDNSNGTIELTRVSLCSWVAIGDAFPAEGTKIVASLDYQIGATIIWNVTWIQYSTVYIIGAKADLSSPEGEYPDDFGNYGVISA